MRQSDEEQRGQSLAELALVLPLLLMILVGMVEVGWAMRAQLTVTTACREGARFASRRVFENDEIQEVVYVAMLALNPVFDGPDANTTIIITQVPIDWQGNLPDEGEIVPYVTGTLGVTSQLDYAFYEQIAADNEDFNEDDAHPDLESDNNVVVVEVFYDHDLLLGTRIGAQVVGLGPMRLYSRSINRIGVSRYE
jgi:hypothetical protein